MKIISEMKLPGQNVPVIINSDNVICAWKVDSFKDHYVRVADGTVLDLTESGYNAVVNAIGT
jgi:hypothetical protein